MANQKWEGHFLSSIVCSQVSLSEIPPPAVASPAYGCPPVARAWRVTIAEETFFCAKNTAIFSGFARNTAKNTAIFSGTAKTTAKITANEVMAPI